MNINKQNITAYILAGGKSSRLGTDKGLYLLNGKPIIEYVISQLKPVVTNIVIVTNNKEYEQFGYEIIADNIADNGPSGGIHAALKHTGTNQNFIVSCDMPFITSDSILFMINNSMGYQITVPVNNGKFEPLFAVFSKECFTKWEEIINNGTKKMMDIINQFNTLKVNIDNNPLFPKSLFLNINTPEDLQKAVDKLVDKCG